jgi:tellurite resistance protein
MRKRKGTEHSAMSDTEFFAKTIVAALGAKIDEAHAPIRAEIAVARIEGYCAMSETAVVFAPED